MLPMVFVCILLAAIFHADMNARPIYDTLWMSGLFLGSVAIMPQLWLMTIPYPRANESVDILRRRTGGSFVSALISGRNSFRIPHA